MQPLISVIIPLYNHEKFIYQAAVSVLEQTYNNLELIIIDDGSRDKSVAVASSLSDPRVKLFTQENKGAHAAINRGIASAQGEYIAILNSDDVYHPRRLQTFVEAIAADKTIDGLFSQVEAIHESNEHYFFYGNYPIHNIPLKRLHPDQRLAADLLGRNIVTTTSNLFCKKEVFDDLGLFKYYRYAHDLDFFLKLFHHRHVRFISESLLCYRFHSTNTIKEDNSLVLFETAIVLSDFLQTHPPQQLFPDTPPEQVHAYFISALNIPHIDRVLLVLSQNSGTDSWPHLRDSLLRDVTHPLRIACLNYLQDSLSLEKKHKEAVQQVENLTDKLEKLKHEYSLYQQSISFRVGRCCTLPARKILSAVKNLFV